MSSKLLVINADDLGYSEERNHGIVECFQNGGITSATVLVNGVAAHAGCALASDNNLPVDLHLNLTEGRPILDASKCPTLVDKDGFFLEKLQLIAALDGKLIDMNEVREEITAQLNRFAELTGRLPFHIDGHQHVHVYPGVCEVFAEVLKLKRIKMTRMPMELEVDKSPHMNSARHQFHERVSSYARVAMQIFQDHDISFTKVFRGLLTMGMDMTTHRLQGQLISAFASISDLYHTDASLEKFILPVVELMVHPGYPCLPDADAGCGQGPDEFAQSPARQHEMIVLGSPEMKQFYKEQQISCVPFSELKKNSETVL